MDAMIEIIKFIQSFSSPFLDMLFELVTMVGDDMFFIFFIALYYWCFNKAFGYKLAFICLTSGVLNTIIKEIVRFPRPIGYEGIKSIRVETAGGYAFPSGHTQQTTALFTTLMLEFKKRWINIIGIVIVILVGFSRMYLGVHWPTDVLGGLIIGVIWTLISFKVFDRSRKKDNPILMGLIVVPAIICLIFFKTYTYYKAVGTLTGLWIGYVIEDRFIRYETKAIWWKQVVKIIIGFVGVILIKVYVKKMLPLSIYSDFVRYSLMAIWMTVVSPLTFRVLQLEERIKTV